MYKDQFLDNIGGVAWLELLKPGLRGSGCPYSAALDTGYDANPVQIT
jgi:hypothetical protein